MTSIFPAFPIPTTEFNFTNVHPKLGSISDFDAMVRSFKKRGVEVILSIDFNGIPTNHAWVQNSTLLQTFSETLGVSRLLIGFDFLAFKNGWFC